MCYKGSIVYFSGKVNFVIQPFPLIILISILPPWAEIILWAAVRPRPSLPVLVVNPEVSGSFAGLTLLG
jgi:hypothetical protein